MLVGKISVRRILKEEGFDPRPRPDRSGSSDFQPCDLFVKLHLSTVVACDFFCKTLWARVYFEPSLLAMSYQQA